MVRELIHVEGIHAHRKDKSSDTCNNKAQLDLRAEGSALASFLSRDLKSRWLNSVVFKKMVHLLFLLFLSRLRAHPIRKLFRLDVKCVRSTTSHRDGAFVLCGHLIGTQHRIERKWSDQSKVHIARLLQMIHRLAHRYRLSFLLFMILFLLHCIFEQRNIGILRGLWSSRLDLPDSLQLQSRVFNATKRVQIETRLISGGAILLRRLWLLDGGESSARIQ